MLLSVKSVWSTTLKIHKVGFAELSEELVCILVVSIGFVRSITYRESRIEAEILVLIILSATSRSFIAVLIFEHGSF